MVWEPFAIAIVFGLVVSAGLYFIVMWPQVEPDDDEASTDPVPAPVQPSPAEPAAAASDDAAQPDPPVTDA